MIFTQNKVLLVIVAVMIAIFIFQTSRMQDKEEQIVQQESIIQTLEAGYKYENGTNIKNVSDRSSIMDSKGYKTQVEINSLRNENKALKNENKNLRSQLENLRQQKVKGALSSISSVDKATSAKVVEPKESFKVKSGKIAI